jgi:hypothetical protein
MDPEAEEKVEVAPEPQDQAKPVTDEGIQDIASRLAGTEGAPDYDDIADWKNAYGVIYASTIREIPAGSYLLWRLVEGAGACADGQIWRNRSLYRSAIQPRRA